MTRAFSQLPDYSASLPTEKYPGKRWRCQMRDGAWWMREYGNIEGDTIRILNRRIFLADAEIGATVL